jgi:hypothetical protein
MALMGGPIGTMVTTPKHSQIKRLQTPETFPPALWSNYDRRYVPGVFMSLSRSVAFSFFMVGCLGVSFPAGMPAFAQSPETTASHAAANHPIAVQTAANQAPANQAPAILPPNFAGWQMQGIAVTGKDPAAADPTSPAILKEYGFSDFSSATYTSDDGRTLKVHAMRFADASGAFGAYTFYLTPEMTKEQVGDRFALDLQGASLGRRVLFYRGHILVDAQFSQESVMSMEQLRELAGALPRPGGSAGNLPEFIKFMPQPAYIVNTLKYAMGPAALSALAPPVPAELVDFGVSSEVSLGRYSTDSGEATLMLISYPTPQLAAAHLGRIENAFHLAKPQEGGSSFESAGSFSARRTGPIIAIVAGPTSTRDAKSLLGLVNWEANVTWNTPSESGQVRELYSLVLNIVVLCAILGGLAIVAGVAFGGIRILMKRWFPEKVFDRPENMEFISLRLTETVVRGGAQTGSDGSPEAP